MAMSECISREERAFLHAMAKDEIVWAQKTHPDQLDKRIGVANAAKALVAALEQGPAPVEPKRERPEPSVTKVSYVLDRIINERDLAERFREDLEYVRADYRKERAAHEELRQRTEKAVAWLRGRDAAFIAEVVGRILKGEET
jgi:hypothetical protein